MYVSAVCHATAWTPAGLKNTLEMQKVGLRADDVVRMRLTTQALKKGLHIGAVNLLVNVGCIDGAAT